MAAQYWAVIPAAGLGTRINAGLPKQYLTINGKCILEHVLEKFCQLKIIEGIVVAIADNDKHWPELEISSHPKIKKAAGGKQRCHSVVNALQLLSSMADSNDWVLVHDAARPCIRSDDIEHLIKSVGDHEVGGLLALPVHDTMKRAGDQNIITETIDRDGLWHALTPQMFRLSSLQAALESCLTNNQIVTDEAHAMELCNQYSLLVEGHPDNIKVTHESDLTFAELYLAQQETG
jgi:2-C-methyl-D-erythritol 4-phosphate cytidylyltransferase